MGDGSSQGQDRSSRERDEEGMRDYEQQHLSKLDYTDLFCFFLTFKGYFGSSVINWLSWDLLFSGSQHTVLYSSA
ncbi:hypothetical protein PFLUV_G00132020 [Perca fluviatilis]|uniref:Uncharacterized protein n=1 Tax=Perca fluviatilis TaxID=8168 RepID=A0A6A5ER22_PERFL|nr:hypothetical protein PFLUV_G00132020 [Perca fluviatilis]